jgi:glyoxylase-like metal-dependent hydrolase (beta-lactamase superfamily II)
MLRGDGKPVIVVNTHHHWDHVWGNWVFEDSLIIAHAKAREMIDRPWDEELRRNAHYLDGKTRKCLPNLLFEEKLCFPDDGVSLFYSPGHTIDGVSVYDHADRVLYAGDNIGDTDETIVPYIDTDLETVKKMLDLYEKYDFEVCVSGHNKPQGKNVLGAMRAALEDRWKEQIEKYGLPG